jgi:glucose/mannose transport system substrate-binding protein
VKWSDSRVTDALETFAKMSSYLNTDHSALTWDEAGQYLLKEKGAMMIMGDWTNGWFMSVGFEDYGWAPPPNNSDYNDYLKSAARDWEKDAISPSVMHGAAASEGWTTEFKDIISL